MAAGSRMAGIPIPSLISEGLSRISALRTSSISA